MWQCQICTYENHYSLPVCEMCDSRRADDEIIHIVCSTTSVIYLVSKQVRSLQGGTENSGTYVHYVTSTTISSSTCWRPFCLKMIGKGFVLFKISSSPSAFYIIKPTCISWLVFKVNKCLKTYRKLRTRRFVYVAEWWRHLSGRMQTASLFVLRAPLNLIFGTLSA